MWNLAYCSHNEIKFSVNGLTWCQLSVGARWSERKTAGLSLALRLIICFHCYSSTSSFFPSARNQLSEAVLPSMHTHIFTHIHNCSHCAGKKAGILMQRYTHTHTSMHEHALSRFLFHTHTHARTCLQRQIQSWNTFMHNSYSNSLFFSLFLWLYLSGQFNIFMPNGNIM